MVTPQSAVVVKLSITSRFPVASHCVTVSICYADAKRDGYTSMNRLEAPVHHLYSAGATRIGYGDGEYVIGCLIVLRQRKE